MFGQTKRVDDFIVQRGSSAKKSVSKSQTETINEIIRSYDLSSKSFTFGGISGGGEFNLTGSQLGKNTVLATVDPDMYKKITGGNLEWAHHTRMTPYIRDLLKSEGVTINDGVTGAVFFHPELVNQTDKMPRVALHELGHGASKSSGIFASEHEIALEEFNKAFEKTQYMDEVHISHASDMQKKYVNLMRSYGLEEGRAEMFAFQNHERKLITAGRSVDEISKAVDAFELSGYATPSAFNNYLNRHSSRMQSVYERLGDNLQHLPSPLTGKTGLTVAEMMEETNFYAKSQAAGSFQGTLEGMTGESGRIHRVRMTARREALNAIAAEKLNAEQAKGLTASLENIATTTAAEGRSLSIADRLAPKPIQAAVTGRPIIRLEKAAFQETTHSARSLTRSTQILEAAAQTAESVVKRDSIGMKIAGAAATIFRRRI